MNHSDRTKAMSFAHKRPVSLKLACLIAALGVFCQACAVRQAKGPAAADIPVQAALPEDPDLIRSISEALDHVSVPDGSGGMRQVKTFSDADGVSVWLHRNGRRPVLISRGNRNKGTGEPLGPGHLYKIASISKIYIAALMFKLNSEGVLDIQSPIAPYLSHITYTDAAGEKKPLVSLIPNIERIRIVDLLAHTSGIHDHRDLVFVKDLVTDPFRARDEFRETLNGLIRNTVPCATPEEARRIRSEGFGVFSPEDQQRFLAQCGDEGTYSNTNYVLAGYILDKIYGEHHSAALKRDLLDPLGLESTYYEKHLRPGQSIDPARVVHGYFDVQKIAVAIFGKPRDFPGVPALPDGRIDANALDDGYGFASGGLIASVEDTGRFYEAIFDPGVAYPLDTVERKREFVSAFVKHVAPGKTSHGDRYVFHAGTIGGFTGQAQVALDKGVTFVLMTNDRGVGYGPVKNAVINRIEEILHNS